MTQPLEFTIAVRDFDIYLLQEDNREVHTVEFREAVAEYYAEQFAPLDGTLSVAFDDDTIQVSWMPGETSKHPFEYAVSSLRAGNYEDALPILDLLLAVNPTNVDVLFNYGIAESDLGHLERAIDLLTRAVEIAPDNADAWTALGVAHQRNGKSEQALLALQKAIQVEPENGYAHQNLGSIFGNQKRFKEAETHLRAAAHLMPRNQANLYGLAHCLEQLGGEENEVEADQIYKQVIALDGDNDIGELAKQAQRRIAQKSFRENVGDNIRMDAVMFCLSALERFANMDQAQIQKITFEVAMLGQNGLDVNNPASKYRLKSIDGEFSGLHLVSIMYVGFKHLRPDANAGFDLSAEYAMAQHMFQQKSHAS